MPADADLQYISAARAANSTVRSTQYDASLLSYSGRANYNFRDRYHERRVELAEESLRFWDLVRTGRYIGTLPADVAARALTHSITTGVVNPIPLLPIELNDAQTWGLPQNPGF